MLKEYLVQFLACIEVIRQVFENSTKYEKIEKSYFQVENVLVDVLIVTGKNQLMMAL